MKRVALALLMLLPAVGRAAAIDFTALPVGTRLATQIPNLTFAPGGIVVDTLSGHVVSFTDFSCEFCASTARISFTVLQRTVSVRVGLFPITVPVQRDIRLAAFDPAGTLVASTTATVVAGAGFSGTLTVATPTPRIAIVTLQAVNDPDLLATIGLHDLTFEDAPPSTAPDFLLEIPTGMSLLQGAAATDLPIAIHRFGGSTGPISFSITALTSGVTGMLTPNPAPTTTETLKLQATDAAHSVQVVTIIGTPTTPLAGGAPRSVTTIIESTPALTVQGSAAIDFGTCAVSAAHGTVVAKYLVVRDYRISGPLQVSLENVPSGVTGSVTPTTLTFSAGAIGQEVVVTLNTVAGPAVPIVSIGLHLSGPGVDLRFPILIFGTCPQQNKNFAIRGEFRVIDHFSDQPLVHAQVEFFRYRSDWYDDWVGSTFTDSDGRFTQDLFASIDGDYYARLRLANEDLNLEDADNSSVWSIDTPHQSNNSGLIDTGITTIIRDSGAGSPRAGTWQAFRKDIAAFRNLGALPFLPGGFLGVIDYRGHVVPLTFYDEVHWSHGYNSAGSTHEFGHVIRHSLDGDGNHWNLDNLQYLYGRDHDHCSQFGNANAGYAFNEGWADFWEDNTSCCPADVKNESIEGTVAHDLNTLSTCAGGKAGLVAVLARGQNIIHSDTEFRIQYARQFPNCPPPALDLGCVPGGGAGSPLHVDNALTAKTIESEIAGMGRALDALVARQKQATGVTAVLLRASVEEASLSLQRLRERIAMHETMQQHLEHGFEERFQRELLRTRRHAIRVRALREALKVPGAPRPEIERRLQLLETSRIDDPSLNEPFARLDFDEDTISNGSLSRQRLPLWAFFVILLLALVIAVVIWKRMRRP